LTSLKTAVKENTMIWVCNACGYIYDPSEGDPEQSIPVGVPFEDLPDKWVCPVCGAPKSEFSPEDTEG